MRTIKFRGLRTDGKGWVYGMLFHNNKIVTETVSYESPLVKKWSPCYKYEYINIIPETVCQFTGLHDKNGKEIYTGDILQLKKLDGSVLLYKIFCVKGGFAFNSHQDDFYKPQIEIYFYESTSDMQSSSFISTLEIIGNIHEDSCLLEKKLAD